MIEVIPWLELFTLRVLSHKGNMRKPQLASTQMSVNEESTALVIDKR